MYTVKGLTYYLIFFLHTFFILCKIMDKAGWLAGHTHTIDEKILI